MSELINLGPYCGEARLFQLPKGYAGSNRGYAVSYGGDNGSDIGKPSGDNIHGVNSLIAVTVAIVVAVIVAIVTVIIFIIVVVACTFVVAITITIAFALTFAFTVSVVSLLTVVVPHELYSPRPSSL